MLHPISELLGIGGAGRGGMEKQPGGLLKRLHILWTLWFQTMALASAPEPVRTGSMGMQPAQSHSDTEGSSVAFLKFLVIFPQGTPYIT